MVFYFDLGSELLQEFSLGLDLSLNLGVISLHALLHKLSLGCLALVRVLLLFDRLNQLVPLVPLVHDLLEQSHAAHIVELSLKCFNGSSQLADLLNEVGVALHDLLVVHLVR